MADSSLRTLQLQELEILCVFSRICLEHDLCWYLTAGTLLGAVRHHGFIPWDDDIDVLMPRKDYDRLANICRHALPKGYFYQDSRSEGNYSFYFSKIRQDGTLVQEPEFVRVKMHQGLYIDIFPLDVCPKSDRAASLYFRAMTLITCALRAQVSPDFICEYTKWHSRGAYELLRRLPRSPLLFLRETLRRAVDFLSLSSGRLCTVGGAHGFPRETYEARWFQGTDMLTFEGKEFPVPSGWANLLNNMYGDYMSPPADEERKGHFIRQN